MFAGVRIEDGYVVVYDENGNRICNCGVPYSLNDVMQIQKDFERMDIAAAKFVLDEMPGRQMAVDADLEAGRITKEEAKKRRRDIMQEVDYMCSGIKKIYIEKNIFFPPLKEIAEANGFNFDEEFVEPDNFNRQFGDWFFNIYLKKEEWKYLRIAIKYIADGKDFLYGLLNKEAVNLEKEYIKEEAKKYGYEIDNAYFLMYKETLSKKWSAAEVKTSFVETLLSKNGREKLKSEFETIIKELSEIGERLEGKLQQVR